MPSSAHTNPHTKESPPQISLRRGFFGPVQLFVITPIRNRALGNRAFARHLSRPERLGTIPETSPPLRQGQPGSPHRQVRAAALLRSSKKNGYPNRHRSLGTVAVLKDTGAKCRKPLRYKDFPDFFRKGPDSFSEKTRMNLPSTVDPPTGVIDLKDTNESLLQKAKKRCRLRRQAMPLVIASALHLFGSADKCFSSSSKEISPKSFPLHCIERFRLVLSVTDQAASSSSSFSANLTPPALPIPSDCAHGACGTTLFALQTAALTSLYATDGCNRWRSDTIPFRKPRKQQLQKIIHRQK